MDNVGGDTLWEIQRLTVKQEEWEALRNAVKELEVEALGNALEAINPDDRGEDAIRSIEKLIDRIEQDAKDES